MKWTDEDKEKLRSLVLTRASWHIIGAHLNRSGAAAQLKAAELGLGPKPRSGNRSPVWALIVRICSDGRPRTVHELVQLTGATRVCIDRLMKDRHEVGQAHTAGWIHRLRGPAAPVWLPVPGKNVARPRARSHAERQRDRVRRMKEDDPLAYKALIDRATVRRRFRRGTVTQQHAVIQAMFGMGAPA